ncbi:MAG: lipoate--protein ligase family protein [bacterium]
MKKTEVHGELTGAGVGRYAVWHNLGLTTASGRDNMMRDQQLLNKVEAGDIQCPILRLYLWQKPTVSLGLNQSRDSVVNLARLQELDYDIVRRPTGGRALLHKGDLCYALLGRKDWHPEFRSLTSTYRAVGEALRLALDMLGVDLVKLESESERRRDEASPCFAMYSPFEVSVAGRKICGSAQRRLRSGFLQHGSLRLADCWTDDDLQAIWPQSVTIQAAQTTSLESELGHKSDPDEVSEVLLRAFADTFQVEILGVSAE